MVREMITTDQIHKAIFEFQRDNYGVSPEYILVSPVARQELIDKIVQHVGPSFYEGESFRFMGILVKRCLDMSDSEVLCVATKFKA